METLKHSDREPRRVGKLPELAAPFGRDPYNTADAPGLKPGDVVEFVPPDFNVEVITLCAESE